MPSPYTARPLNENHSTADVAGHIQHHDDLAFYVNGLSGDARLLGVTVNPKLVGSSGSPSAGVISVARIQTPTPITVTNIETIVTTAPTGTSQANCFLGLYDVSSLARLAITLDASTALGSAGRVVVPLVTPLVWAGGPGTALYAAVLIGTAAGTTPMALAKSTGSGNSSVVNFEYTSPQFAAATGGSALSALPSTLPTLSAAGNLWLLGLS